LSPVTYTKKKKHQNSLTSLSNLESPNSSESIDDSSMYQSTKLSDSNSIDHPLKHSNFFDFSILKELRYDDDVEDTKAVGTKSSIILDVGAPLQTDTSIYSEAYNVNSTKTLSSRTKQNDKKVISVNNPTARHYAASANSVRRNLWGTVWAKKKKYYQKKSAFGHLKSWDIASMFIFAS
jgi:hypothetical protein